MNNVCKLLTCILSLSVLAACSGAKETLGLTKESPDEFLIVKRAPLEMPPNFNLRPPTPGADRPQEKSTGEEARSVIFGETGQPTQAPVRIDAASNVAENTLLNSAGAQYANKDIRAIVDQETLELSDRNETVAKKLFGIGGDKNAASATVVNSVEESERLKKNTEAGKSVTDGETPTIEQ